MFFFNQLNFAGWTKVGERVTRQSPAAELVLHKPVPRACHRRFVTADQRRTSWWSIFHAEKERKRERLRQVFSPHIHLLPLLLPPASRHHALRSIKLAVDHMVTTEASSPFVVDVHKRVHASFLFFLYCVRLSITVTILRGALQTLQASDRTALAIFF